MSNLSSISMLIKYKPDTETVCLDSKDPFSFNRKKMTTNNNICI